MSTDIWLFEEPPRRLLQIERRSCQLQRELEHWLFLPTLSMSLLSKNGATRSLVYKGMVYKGFFGPVLDFQKKLGYRVLDLGDLRV